jgi:hypothetical protein
MVWIGALIHNIYCATDKNIRRTGFPTVREELFRLGAGAATGSLICSAENLGIREWWVWRWLWVLALSAL